jgi:hypothetical protein
MKTKKILIASVLAVALFGCGKHEPRHIVILPDVSGSIDRESLEQAFKAIDELAGHLHRGDRLTIIPILGDAEAEASGKILRFEVPDHRQAYDTDLRDFRIKLNASLKEMRANAIARPGSKTDILGSIKLVKQEFQLDLKSKLTLIILSDFIQEDEEVNFRKDSRLYNQAIAKKFAAEKAKKGNLDFHNCRILLGLLRSQEYRTFSMRQRDAILAFWSTYFKYSGSIPMFVIDGPNALNQI